MLRRSSQDWFWLYTIGVLLVIGFASAGCYDAHDLRKIAAEKPDPRQKQVDLLWDTMREVMQEEAWPVELQRREDLIMATAWMPLSEEVRRRVRFLVVVAPMGVGINVSVKYQQRNPEAPPEAAWNEVTDPVILARQRREEEALAHRIRGSWLERL